MKIEVLLFAQLKDAFQTDRRVVEVAEGRTARDVAAALLQEHPTIAALPVSLAVNEEFVGDECCLREGDRLALIPPVSGG